MSEPPKAPHSLGIWGFAFGYFACYVPYSALTKALSTGAVQGIGAVDGLSIFPLSVAASVVGMFTFLSVIGWWRFATQRLFFGRLWPCPTRWTFLSGLCTAAIVVTTTLAYTFDGVSIVFVMLLMRGGVLITAPVVDAFTGRKTRWFSWLGLGLSLAALLVAFSESGGYEITLVCAVDVAFYLAAYFVRLRFMSRLAKSADADVTKRYFVEEQMVATPTVLLALAFLASFGPAPLSAPLRAGFLDVWSWPLWLLLVLVGLFSQGTGVFGGLVLLDRRENTYCVPVNRSSSVLAGVLASFSLAFFLGMRTPSLYQLAGAGLVVCAVLVLSLPPLFERRR